jgi:Zn ribbon nucleic-acid-binding protein
MTDSIDSLSTEKWFMAKTTCQACQNRQVMFYPLDFDILLECSACGEHQALPDVNWRVLVSFHQLGDSFWFSLPHDESDPIGEVIGPTANDIHEAAGLFINRVRDLKKS